MAERDYSGTPLWKKLGVKEAARVAIVDGPAGFAGVLGRLPPDARIVARPTGRLDVIVLFATSATRLPARFERLARALEPDGGLWVAYPKRSSGVATDLTFENVQAVGLGAGLVDNKSCAVDETWSALRFVYRLKDRGMKEPKPLATKRSG